MLSTITIEVYNDHALVFKDIEAGRHFSRGMSAVSVTKGRVTTVVPWQRVRLVKIEEQPEPLAATLRVCTCGESVNGGFHMSGCGWYA
jgi:hypothetical protein